MRRERIKAHANAPQSHTQAQDVREGRGQGELLRHWAGRGRGPGAGEAPAAAGCPWGDLGHYLSQPGGAGRPGAQETTGKEAPGAAPQAERRPWHQTWSTFLTPSVGLPSRRALTCKCIKQQSSRGRRTETRPLSAPSQGERREGGPLCESRENPDSPGHSSPGTGSREVTLTASLPSTRCPFKPGSCPPAGSGVEHQSVNREVTV